MKQNAFLDHPEVGDNIFAEVESFKKKYDKYQMKNQNAEIENFAQNFYEAIENLPKITEQKKINQNHVKTSINLMKIIDERGLEKFCVISNEILNKKKISSDHLIECKNLFKNKEFVKLDKIRLLFIILKNSGMNKEEYQKLEKDLVDNTVLEQNEIELLQNSRDDFYKNNKRNTSLFSSLKTTSSKFIKNIVRTQYLYNPSILLANLFNKSKMLETLEIFQILNQQQEFLLRNIEDIYMISLNGGHILEHEELQNLQIKLNKNIYYGMDCLETSREMFEKLKKNKIKFY